MSNFLDKYNIIENSKSLASKKIGLTIEEKNRKKLIISIDNQLMLIDALVNNKHDVPSAGNISKKQRLFWRDTLGGYLFTPRFGNDFIFGKNRGIQCASYQDLRILLTDFRSAVESYEFDDRMKEISTSRQGRGAGVSRNRG